jgi:hypothetical protein
MVFNTTFNNISFILWRLFFGGENCSTCRKPSTCRKSLTNFITIQLYQVDLGWAGFEITTIVEIGINCIGSCKSNYHTIKTASWLLCKIGFLRTTLHRRQTIDVLRILVRAKYINDVCLSRISQGDVSDFYIGSYWKSVIMFESSLLFDNIVCKDEREILYYISSINIHYIQSLVTIHYMHVISLSNISIKTILNK